MKIIHGARRSGKTTQLIKEAAKRDARIICINQGTAREVNRMANDMGISIKMPQTAQWLLNTHILGKEKVLLDNAEHILSYLLSPRAKILAMTLNDESNTEQKYNNSDPDFSNAKKGDLIWNDAFGLGKVKDIATKEIIIEFESVHSTCFFDGRYISNSPKSTFFYSDGAGNNYLTKRPRQEIDFSTLKTGDRILVDKQARAYFIAYNPNACFPVWIAHHKYKDGNYYNMELVATGRVSVARIEED